MQARRAAVNVVVVMVRGLPPDALTVRMPRLPSAGTGLILMAVGDSRGADRNE